MLKRYIKTFGQFLAAFEYFILDELSDYFSRFYGFKQVNVHFL